MSILDFTTGLFRDPASLRSFLDDPEQALDDAGLPDATPQQVRDLLPLVAESMPADHPLQTVVHAADPLRALAELDFDMHDHHRETPVLHKALGAAEGRLDDDDDVPAETIHVGHWLEEPEKAIGDLFAAQLEEPEQEPVYDYPDPPEDHAPGGDHAVDDAGVDLDISAVAWGKAIE